jgi:hypothetical protein
MLGSSYGGPRETSTIAAHHTKLIPCTNTPVHLQLINLGKLDHELEIKQLCANYMQYRIVYACMY